MTEIALASGVDITLRELTQSLVYEGLLEGLPTRERNERWIEEKVAAVREAARGRPVVCLEPGVEPIRTRELYPFGVPEALPAVVCTGRFRADSCVAADPEDGDTYSELIVLWFQREFALPIDPDVLERIRALDWRALAADAGD